MDMSYIIKSREEFVQNFTKNLDQHPNVKVAIIGKHNTFILSVQTVADAGGGGQGGHGSPRPR